MYPANFRPALGLGRRWPATANQYLPPLGTRSWPANRWPGRKLDPRPRLGRGGPALKCQLELRPSPAKASGRVGLTRWSTRSRSTRPGPFPCVGRGLAETSRAPKTTPLAGGVKMGCLDPRPTPGRTVRFGRDPRSGARREETRFPGFFAFFTKITTEARRPGEDIRRIKWRMEN